MKNAEVLDRLLSGDPVEEDIPQHDEAAVLAELADMLAESRLAEPVVMRAEARNALRLDLIREANLQRSSQRPPLLTRLREAVTARVEHAAYSARLATGSGIAALVLSTGGVATATDRSLPGDLLYSLKLGVEDALAWFAGSDAAYAQALLDQATARIAEAVTAAERGSQDVAADALVLADSHAREGAQELLRAYENTADTAHLQTLQDFVTATSRQLDLIGELFDGEARDRIDDLRVSLGRMQQRVLELSLAADPDGALGVHDDPEAAETIARGVELDGTPPLPPGTPVDFTEIPAADQPFLPCSFCLPSRDRPASSPATPTEPAPSSSEPPSAPPSGGGGGAGGGTGGGGGSGGGGGGSGGGGGGPLPQPDVGPVIEQLPPQVSDPVQEILESLPPADAPAQSPAQPEGEL